MSKIDETYHKLLNKILQEGYRYEDPNRKGVSRIEIPSYTFRHEFKDGFPAIITRKLHYKNVVTELLWFLRGDTNIKYLVDNGCNIWNKDAYNYYVKNYNKEKRDYPLMNIKDFIECIKIHDFEVLKNWNSGYDLGDLGKVYGHYWRNSGAFNDEELEYSKAGFDQIKDIIDKMINTPMSSEIIVTARNPNDKDFQALPCCHFNWQIVMRPLNLLERTSLGNFKLGETVTDSKCDLQNMPKYGFELHFSMRTNDVFLGNPYNIASYATLALILEKITGHKALGIQGDLKKVHLYDNSLDAVKEQLSRDVNKYSKCELEIQYRSEYHRLGLDRISLDNLISNIEITDFNLENYESYPALNVEMLSRNK